MRLTSRFSKPTPLSVETPRWTPSHTTTTRRSQSLRSLCLCAALLISFTGVLAQAQDYTSIVVFGDSLSDTGNFADLTQTKYGVRIPGPDANYTDGRFTDGDDTLPAARKYFGLWIEQFAAMLPAKPAIKTLSTAAPTTHTATPPTPTVPRPFSSAPQIRYQST